MVHATGEDRAVHLSREAVELRDAGHHEAAVRNLREALTLAPNNAAVKDALVKIQQDEGNGHHLIDLCRRYTTQKDEKAGKDAARYLQTDGLVPPEGVALECAKLLLSHQASSLSSLQDDIISGLVRQNASVRQFFSSQLQVSVTTFFDEIYSRGDGAAVCLDTVVLDPSVWPSEDDRLHCERELFQLFIAKLMESGHDLDGRSLKGIARLLAVDAAKLRDLVDDESLDVIVTSLDHRLPLEWRSQATLATVKYLEVSKEVGEKQLSGLISAKLSKSRIDDFIVAFSATAAVFPVAPEVAAGLFLSDTFMASLKPLTARDPKSRRMEKIVLELLSAACISSTSRDAISKNFSDWLSHILSNGSDQSSELAAVILAKIRASGNNGTSTSNGKVHGNDNHASELVDRFKGLMLRHNGENIANAIEGLAYSSIDPEVKEQLAGDSSFLRGLIKVLHEKSNDTSVLYGGLMIILNLTQFLPNLSEEQKKISQLKSYAEAKQNGVKNAPNVLEDDEHVIARCNIVVDTGVVPLLVACGRSTTTPSIHELISRIMLSLSRNPKSRGTLAQQGAAKLLLNIASSDSNFNATIQNTSHALARVLISVNPSHVFPLSGFPHVTSAIRPLVALLMSPEATNITAEQPSDMLPVFESLLALTNLATHPDVAAPEAIVRHAWAQVEDLLLSGNPLIQRAACELVCNLMTCESGVIKLADGTKRAAQRLHILIALTDTDDLTTRRAAGGALAMLTEFDAVIAGILDRPRGVQLLLNLCQEDDDGLVHRGVTCVRNLTCAASGEIGRRAIESVKEGGGVEVLSNMLKKTRNQLVLQIGVEALKPLVG
ncbi:myosin-binding striated muscle assembly central-domain-containing protein [Aspergillus cavernicola]|uniref:Myosin-binding striated muscle assembly central-domain-containing protein n=1 Tax=Aspergillus cavernicola TaxID=176166 RepID=A0ABR4IQ67_9EURO